MDLNYICTVIFYIFCAAAFALGVVIIIQDLHRPMRFTKMFGLSKHDVTASSVVLKKLNELHRDYLQMTCVAEILHQKIEIACKITNSEASASLLSLMEEKASVIFKVEQLRKSFIKSMEIASANGFDDEVIACGLNGLLCISSDCSMSICK